MVPKGILKRLVTIYNNFSPVSATIYPKRVKFKLPTTTLSVFEVFVKCYFSLVWIISHFPAPTTTVTLRRPWRRHRLGGEVRQGYGAPHPRLFGLRRGQVVARCCTRLTLYHTCIAQNTQLGQHPTHSFYYSSPLCFSVVQCADSEYIQFVS